MNKVKNPKLDDLSRAERNQLNKVLEKISDEYIQKAKKLSEESILIHRYKKISNKNA